MLARRGGDHLRFDTSLRKRCGPLTDLAPLAAERPRVLLVRRIRIGEKREFAARYLLNEERLGRVGLHEKRQLVHPLLLANPGQQPGLFHIVDEIGQALLGHVFLQKCGFT